MSITDADLPQDVYEENGNLLGIAEGKLLSLILASPEDEYTIIEEFMNYMILDSIQTNINSSYDPLGDLDTDEANFVFFNDVFYIDYVFATLNEDDQIVVCISFGTDKYITMHSALFLNFDVDIDLIDLSVTLTLESYYLSDNNLSLTILDFIFNQLDKTSIEESITSGVLDLDDYTYTVSVLTP